MGTSRRSSFVHLSKEEEVKMWHKKLSDLILKGMKKAISVQAIKWLPKLKIVEGDICGEC